MTSPLIDRAKPGFALLTLLYQMDAWVLRRAERLTFDDALVVRRRSVLDLTLERFTPLSDEVLPQWKERALLPLMLVARDTYHDIVIETASGESLPFLPRSEERKFLAAGLAELSLLLDDRDRRTFSRSDVREKEFEKRAAVIEKYIDRSPRATAEAVDPSVTAIADYLPDFVENHVVIATPRIDEIAAADGPHAFRSRGLVRLIECHAESYPATSHHAFKIDTLNEAIKAPHSFASAYAGHRVEHECSPHIWDRKWHFDDLAVTIPISQIQGGESVHVELVCPPGVYVEQAMLLSATTSDSGPAAILEIADDDQHWDTAHVHYSAHLHGPGLKLDPSTQMSSVLLIVLRPMYHGLMHGGQNISCLSAALLWLLTFSVGWRSTEWGALIELPVRSGDTADAIVALLLLAPTAALAMLIREDEHMLTKHVSRAYRVRLGALALLTFIAATLIAVGLGGWQLFVCLFVLSSVGTILAARTWHSARRSATRVAASPAPPEWFSR